MLKHVLTLTIVVALAAAPVLAQGKSKKAGGEAGLKAKLMKMDHDLWEAWKNGDTKPYQASVANDAIEITPTGTASRDQILQALTSKQCQVNSYSLDESGAQLLTIDKDAAVVIYKATVDATCNGMKIPTDILNTTTWAKRGGQWKAVLHQETVPVAGGQQQQQ